MASVDENIAWSDTIVRAKFHSVTATVEEGIWDAILGGPAKDIERCCFAGLEFQFDVLEYLKGSGPSRIKAVAIDIGYDEKVGRHATRDAALAHAKALARARDAQWDGREAVLMLGHESRRFPDRTASTRYWFGLIFSLPSGTNDAVYIADHFSLSSLDYRIWLPEVKTSGASGSTGGKRFLTGVSTTSSAAGTSGRVAQAAQQPSIALSTLKSRIATMEAEIAAGRETERTNTGSAWQKNTNGNGKSRT